MNEQPENQSFQPNQPVQPTEPIQPNQPAQTFAPSPGSPSQPESAVPTPTDPASTFAAAPFVSRPGPVSSSPVSSTSHKAESDIKSYMSNPFLNVVRSLGTNLRNNPGTNLLITFIGILVFFVVYFGSLIALVGFSATAYAGNQPPSGAFSLTYLPVVFFISLLLTVIIAALLATGLASMRGEKISTKTAVGVVFSKLLPLIGLSILSTLVIVAGLFLLVIPGLYLIARLSLSTVVMFAEDLGPIASMKRSFAMTKGHVFEMWGALLAGSFCSGSSFGLLSGPTIVAPLLGRYEDIKALEASNSEKPKTHWLNFFLPGIFILLFAIGFAAPLILATQSGLQDRALETKQRVDELEQQQDSFSDEFNTNLPDSEFTDPGSTSGTSSDDFLSQ